MFLILGASIVFFLPFLESADKDFGFALLLIGSILIGYPLLRQRVKFDLPDLLFCLFLIAASISMLSSLSFSRSLAELLRYIAYFLIFLRLRRLDGPEKRFFEKFFPQAVILSAILLSIVSLFYLLSSPSLSYPTGGMNLYFSTFGHNHLAGVLLVAIPLILGRFLAAWEGKKIWLTRNWFILLLFFLTTLVFTYSRSAYLIVFLYFLFTVKHTLNFFLSKWIYPLVVITISIFLVLQFVFFLSFTGQNIPFLPKQFHKPIGDPELRIDYFQQAIEGFKTAPLFGTGLDTFRFVSYRFQQKALTSSNFVHNHFLQLFAETGFVGGSLFLIFIIMIFINIYKSRIMQKNNFYLAIFLSLIGTVLNNLLDYDFQFLSVFLYFWVGAALLLSKEKEKYIARYENKLTEFTFVPVFILVAIIGTTALFSSVFLNLTKRGDLNSIRYYQLSSLLRFWQASYQQKIAEIFLENKNYDLARYYNDKAQRLEAENPSYYTFRAYLEDGLGNISLSRQAHISAIRSDFLDMQDSYLSLYRLYLVQAKRDIVSNNWFEALRNLDRSRILFPKLAEEASASANLNSALEALKNKNQNKAVIYLNKYIDKGLNDSLWYKMSDFEMEYTFAVLNKAVDNK